MQPIDVYIDWENVGAARNPGGELQQAEFMIRGLNEGLKERGFEVRRLTGFGSMNHGRLISGIRKTLKRTFNRYNADFVWSDTIADRMMIKRLVDDDALQILAPTVALVTCDKHFANTAQWLKSMEYHVIAIGFQVSRKLTKEVDEVHNLRDVIFGLSEEERNGFHSPPLENSIPIPAIGI